MHLPAMLPWFAVIAASMVAAMIDLRTRRIPNLLTGPFLLAGLVLAAAGAPGFSGVGAALFGALIAGLPFIILWVIGAGGAGDAKMMLGIGAWLGPHAGLSALAGVALAGGVLAIGVAIARGRLGQTLISLPRVALALPLLLAGTRQADDRGHLLSALVASGDTAPDANGGDETGDETGKGTGEGTGAAARSRAARIAYGPAIFIGLCGAAAWMWWNA